MQGKDISENDMRHEKYRSAGSAGAVYQYGFSQDDTQCIGWAGDKNCPFAYKFNECAQKYFERTYRRRFIYLKKFLFVTVHLQWQELKLLIYLPVVLKMKWK